MKYISLSVQTLKPISIGRHGGEKIIKGISNTIEKRIARNLSRI